MERVPEPELMDDPAQARAYAEADFSEPHDMFVRLFSEAFPGEALDGYVLDLGCGSADVTVRFAQANPACRVHGVDGAENMLVFGRAVVDKSGVGDRITLIRGRLPQIALPRNQYQALISNSLLHHLDDPLALWRTIKDYAESGAPILVMDLKRPDSAIEVDALVEQYASDAPEPLRRDFRRSLFAAYRVDEVRQQLTSVGLAHMAVRAVSDRHLSVTGRLR